MPAPLPPEPSSSPDKASHRYLQPKPRGDKHQNGSSNNKNGAGYYARDNVTRRARRPIAMANLDDSDLDPLWQNLDWYVPSAWFAESRRHGSWLAYPSIRASPGSGLLLDGARIVDSVGHA